MNKWWEDTLVFTGEGARRITIMLYGTPEEQAELKVITDAEHAAWEHGVVARYAYHEWERAGRPEGRDVEFWLAGEKAWEADQW